MRAVSLSLLGLCMAMILLSCATPQPEPDRDSRLHKAARINVDLGIAYMSEGSLELSKEKLEKAMRQDPELSTAQWTYALLQMRLGNSAAAEEHFRKALALDPSDSKAHNNFGILLCSEDRIAEAEEQFRLAVANPLYTEPESAYTNAGQCVLKVPDQPKAETYFREAIKRNPKYPPALYQMASLAFEQKRYLQARAFMQRFEQAAKHNSTTLWLSYQIEHHLGNKGSALKAAEQLKRDFPESRETTLLIEFERNDG